MELYDKLVDTLQDLSKVKNFLKELSKENVLRNTDIWCCHVTYAFQSESTLYICMNVKELLARSRDEIWSLSDCNWTPTNNHLVHKRTLNHFARVAKWLSWLWVLICTVHLTICSCHVTYMFQREYTLYICLNIKELLARSRREIWSLSDCNWTRIHNHLVHKRTLNYLAKVAKWLNCVVSTYLYGAFDCMFLSCHVRVTEWIHTLYLHECQGTPWVFVYELSGCGFESSCSHLNFRFRACFEQGVPWHSGKYRMWIHSETRTWHDKNIQSNAPYR